MSDPLKEAHLLQPNYELFQLMCGSSTRPKASSKRSKSSNHAHSYNQDVDYIQNIEDVWVEDVPDIEDVPDVIPHEEDNALVDNHNDVEDPPAKRPYKFHKNRDLEDPEEIRTEKDFALVFRMSRSTFEKLLKMVAFKFPRLGLSTNGKSLSPRQRLLMFLHMCGSDTPGIYRRHNYQLSAGCINENMTVCIDVLYQGNIIPHDKILKNTDFG